MPGGDRPRNRLVQSDGAEILTRRALAADLGQRPGQRLDVGGRDRAADDHRELVEARCLARCPAGEEGVLEVQRHGDLGVERRGVFDLVAERLDQVEGAAQRRDALGVALEAWDRRLLEKADAKRFVDADLLHVRPRRFWCDIGITGRRAVNGVEQRSGVANRAADAERSGEPRHDVAEQRPLGDPLARRLQPDEAVDRGRDANRAAAVVGVGERHHARRRRRRPSRPRSRRPCARGSTGCGSLRRPWARSSAGFRARGRSSCRRRRGRRPSNARRDTSRSARGSRRP